MVSNFYSKMMRPIEEGDNVFLEIAEVLNRWNDKKSLVIKNVVATYKKDFALMKSKVDELDDYICGMQVLLDNVEKLCNIGN